MIEIAIVGAGPYGLAVASHLRAGGGWYPVAFLILVGALVWAGLLLREPRLRALIPLRRQIV